MPALTFVINTQDRSLARAFNDSTPVQLPAVYQGDTLEISQRFVVPTGSASAPFSDYDASAAYVQMGIGFIGTNPTAGTFFLTDPDSATSTGPIPFNASAAAVQTAVRTLADWSLATVTGSAGGPWLITNGVNAARNPLQAGTGLLTPPSTGVIFAIQPGTADTPAIQEVELFQAPIAYQDAWTASPAASITVTEITHGGAGVSEVQSIVLGGLPYAGTFTLAFGGQATTPLAYNASPLVVQNALLALSTIGAGNVTVGGIAGAYQVTFTGTLTGAQALLTANAAALVAPLLLNGNLALNTAGIEEAIGEAASISAILEIKITPAGGFEQVVLQTPITILNDLIKGAPSIPTPGPVYLTKSQSDARYLQITNFKNSNPTALTISATGSSTVARLAPTTIQYVTAGAGSGAYAYGLTLGTVNAVRGDIAYVIVSMAASVNPTINVIGSATEAVVGNGNAWKSTLFYVFNGTSWDLFFRTA